MFFLAVPRLFVELRWFQFASQARQSGEGDEDPYKDIRPGGVGLMAHALDVILIAGSISAFYGFDFNPLRALDLFRD